jgi:hypothetical protein
MIYKEIIMNPSQHAKLNAILCVIVFCFLILNGCMPKRVDTIQLTTIPEGAKVTVDGKNSGESPVSFFHKYNIANDKDAIDINLEKEGYYPTSRTIYPLGLMARVNERDYVRGSNLGKGDTFPIEIYLKPDKSEAEWKEVKKSNNLETLENFLREYPDTSYISAARKLIKPLIADREKNELERIQEMIDSSELLRVPGKDIAKADNLLLKQNRFNNVMIYYQGEGDSKPKRVTIRRHKLIKLHDLPGNSKNTISWKNNKIINTGILYMKDDSIVLIFPREVLPCELEFPDVLYNRVIVRK